MEKEGGSGQFIGKDIVRGTEVRPGVWRYSIRGHVFDVPKRYTPIKWLGQGSYGIVCAAKDNQATDEADQTVAIKKIILNNAKTGDLQWKRTLREIRLMRHFDNENLLALKDIFELPAKENFDEVYELSDDHIQLILFQILRGLKYIHSAHVLHRDLKPSNLFINKDVLLKIADFGLARVAHPEDNYDGFTQYVATRWYRAPEVILSWKQYTNAIDMWSIGCIFAELLMRRPLFQGKDHIKQVECICEIMGTPSEEDIAGISSSHARQFVRNMGAKPKTPLQKLMPRAPPQALDLLEKMLAFNPAKRITVEDALCHPYLAYFHDPDDEPECHSAFDFSFEKLNLSLADFKMLIFQEMLHFHPEADPNNQRSKTRQSQLSTKGQGSPQPQSPQTQPQSPQQQPQPQQVKPAPQPTAYRPIAPRPMNPQPSPLQSAAVAFSQQSQQLILQQQMKLHQMGAGGQQPIKILPLPSGQSGAAPVGYLPVQPAMPLQAPIAILPQGAHGYVGMPPILPAAASGYSLAAAAAPPALASAARAAPAPSQVLPSTAHATQPYSHAAAEGLISFDSPTSLMLDNLLSSETVDDSACWADFDDDGMDVVGEGQLDPDDVFRSYLGQ
ncbi:Mitogenactivated protein kinase 5, putative [Acanthamoeba castellanii str. Neff]|uniref:Mitogenactivated protein kinase 5, putative n=1 Tax=Acanthamoeba castellanii (strain ATCC 30010 / Neff) TaxID=1257118 RepID=L8H7P6_ACACF|nr:Mitogenactivated protein kinase 5, putative [Acanthamoeba castellanii str. Neff]ELR21145.1 Mitogenactivated protein kinase 5, putative [Acanthamoeba castellanii str. Neff]